MAGIPLPGVGSIYAIARQLGISVSDTSSGPYRGFVRGIYRASRPTVPVLGAGGTRTVCKCIATWWA
ncbi:MAG: hypothetical protein VCC68_06680 [Myxococcota bacterium]